MIQKGSNRAVIVRQPREPCWKEQQNVDKNCYKIITDLSNKTSISQLYLWTPKKNIYLLEIRKVFSAFARILIINCLFVCFRYAFRILHIHRALYGASCYNWILLDGRCGGELCAVRWAGVGQVANDNRNLEHLSGCHRLHCVCGHFILHV